MKNPVLIFGAGALGRAAREIFEMNEIVVFGFLDDNKKIHGTTIDDIAVLGSTDDDGFLKLIGKKCEAFVAIDHTAARKSIVKMLHDIRHVQPVNATHPHALLARSVGLGHGNMFDAGMIVGPGTSIGHHNLFHARSFVAAECRVGDFVQVGAGAVINSGVALENECFVGSGAVIVSGVTIGAGARIGAGSVVIAPVKAGETVFGNPAQVVKT